MSHFNLSCQVNECTKLFNNSNTWYNHVMKSHRDVYYKSAAVLSLPIGPSEEDGMSSDDSEDEEVSISSPIPTPEAGEAEDEPAIHETSAFISNEVVVKKLLKLKEKHLLSQPALDEVVDLVKLVSDSTITNSLVAVLQSAETCCMDFTSHFFQQLPEVFASESLQLRQPTSNTRILQRIYLMWYVYDTVCRNMYLFKGTSLA